jgi:hypothetical protein
MTKKIHFVYLLMMMGCANVNADTSTDKTGRKIYELTCSEFNTTFDECIARASDMCGHNYKLLSHYEEVYEDSGDGHHMHPRHHLVVECKK